MLQRRSIAKRTLLHRVSKYDDQALAIGAMDRTYSMICIMETVQHARCSCRGLGLHADKAILAGT